MQNINVLCGVHPVILNFDVMRNCVSKLDGIMDSCQQFNEVVDHLATGGQILHRPTFKCK